MDAFSFDVDVFFCKGVKVNSDGLHTSEFYKVQWRTCTSTVLTSAPVMTLHDTWYYFCFRCQCLLLFLCFAIVCIKKLLFRFD